MTLSPQEREDDSARCYEVGIEAIRRELEISRKALAEIAKTTADWNMSADDLCLEYLRLKRVARRALEEIQEARRG